MTDMTELKNCPFCGESVSMKPWRDKWCFEHSPKSECLFTAADEQLFETETEAITAWNTRSEIHHA